MGESPRWIIILAGGWEPSEEEQAQFISELAQTKFPQMNQEFTYVPPEYTRQEEVEIFSDTTTVFVTFSTVPHHVLAGEIEGYLRAEMPVTLRLAESSNYEITSEAYTHPQGYECAIVCLCAPSKLPSAQPAQKPFRKMVQQIKAVHKTYAVEKSRRQLRPLQRVPSLVPKKVIPLMPTEKKQIPQEIPVFLQDQGEDGRDSSPSEAAASFEKAAPPGSNEEWASFLQDLGDAVGTGQVQNQDMVQTEGQVQSHSSDSPSAPPLKPEIERRATLKSKAHVPTIPTMYTHFQEERETKKSEFEEWNEFLSELDGEVATGSQPPTEKRAPEPQPVTSDKDWKNFVNELGKEAGAGMPPEEQKKPEEKEKKEERSDSKIFQGRGLLLSPEEIALEEAIKKREGKKQIVKRSAIKREVTPPPLGIPPKDPVITPTIRRVPPPKETIPSMPPISSEFPPVKFGQEVEEVQHTLRRVSEKALTTAHAPRMAPPQAAVSAPGPQKSSKRWLWPALVVFIAVVGTSGYILKERIHNWWEETKLNYAKAEEQKKNERKYQELVKSIKDNPAMDAKTVMEHLKAIQAFSSAIEDKPEAKRLWEDIQTKRKELLEKTRQNIEKNASDLLNQKKLAEALLFISPYIEIQDLEKYCQTIQYALVKQSMENCSATQEYEREVDALLGLFTNRIKLDHRELETKRNIVVFIHRDILLHTARYEYEVAKEKLEAYRKKISALELDTPLGISDIIEAFSIHIEVERKYWENLVEGLNNMEKEKKKWKFSYYPPGESTPLKTEGKIKVSSRGEFRIDDEKLNLAQLTRESHNKILEKAKDKMKEEEAAFGYALLQFSQGRLAEAKKGFLDAGKEKDYTTKAFYK